MNRNTKVFKERVVALALSVMVSVKVFNGKEL